jgi:hypothetical protein
MGMRMLETCWAVFKQVINFRSLLHLVGWFSWKCNTRHFCYGATGECLLVFPIPSMCALSRLFQAQCATRQTPTCSNLTSMVAIIRSWAVHTWLCYCKTFSFYSASFIMTQIYDFSRQWTTVTLLAKPLPQLATGMVGIFYSLRVI